MGWEWRGKCRYYYRNGQRNGRPERTYFGNGLVGQFAADIDRQEEAKETARGELARHEQKHLEDADMPVIRMSDAVDLVVKATLLSQGFRRHDRGQWRKGIS
jgi:hypothetical protein